MAAVAIAVSFASCDKEEDDDDDYVIWDFGPITIDIQIVDNKGVDLLSEGSPLHGADFKMLYDNQEFTANWEKPIEPQAESRYYMPHLYGLLARTITIDGKSKNTLYFGELDGAGKNTYKMTFIEPDGTKHPIVINREVTTKGYDVYVTQDASMDGKALNYPNDKGPNLYITIVK